MALNELAECRREGYLDPKEERDAHKWIKGVPRADEARMKLRLTNVLTVPRSPSSSEVERNAVGDFLARSLANTGLIVGLQLFPAKQFRQTVKAMTHIHLSSGGAGLNACSQIFAQFPPDRPQGSNVFAVMPGELWGTPDDEVSLIGAHWDTTPSSDGMNDNGSGVTAVLETASALASAVRSSGCTRPRHSVVFALFDLEEAGGQGSLAFVQG